LCSQCRRDHYVPTSGVCVECGGHSHGFRGSAIHLHAACAARRRLRRTVPPFEGTRAQRQVYERANRAFYPIARKELSPCGTTGQYTRGCRCDQCRAAFAAYFRQWRKRDTPAAERHREKQSRRKHIKRKLIYARDGGICYLCGLATDPRDFHIDHVIPVARGGPNTPDNLKTTHPACNMAKKDKLLSELAA